MSILLVEFQIGFGASQLSDWVKPLPFVGVEVAFSVGGTSPTPASREKKLKQLWKM